MNKKIGIEEKKEHFSMFKCPTCRIAKDVWYDTKGCYCHEDIYACIKCGYSFVVSAICGECGSSHSRAYGCNNPDCNSEEYYYDKGTEKIERKL